MRKLRGDSVLHKLLTNRLILIGLILLFVVAGVCWFYSWNVQRTIDAESAKTDAMLNSLKNDNASDVQDTVDTILVDSEQVKSSLANGDTQMSDATVTPVDNDSEMLDTADASLPEETPAEDIPVSPFGFGPYPEIPEGYSGTAIPWQWDEETLAKLEEGLGVTFEEQLRISELFARVGIKLFNEGIEFYGITSLDSNGLFYPSEPNVVYVEWKETTDSNGQVRRYISDLMGGAGLLTMEQRMGYEPIPDWIEVRSYDEGIDPYEFLGLDR